MCEWVRAEDERETWIPLSWQPTDQTPSVLLNSLHFRSWYDLAVYGHRASERLRPGVRERIQTSSFFGNISPSKSLDLLTWPSFELCQTHGSRLAPPTSCLSTRSFAGAKTLSMKFLSMKIVKDVKKEILRWFLVLASKKGVQYGRKIEAENQALKNRKLKKIFENFEHLFQFFLMSEMGKISLFERAFSGNKLWLFFRTRKLYQYI